MESISTHLEPYLHLEQQSAYLFASVLIVILVTNEISYQTIGLTSFGLFHILFDFFGLNGIFSSNYQWLFVTY